LIKSEICHKLLERMRRDEGLLKGCSIWIGPWKTDWINCLEKIFQLFKSILFLIENRQTIEFRNHISDSIVTTLICYNGGISRNWISKFSSNWSLSSLNNYFNWKYFNIISFQYPTISIMT
jgi:hypothetical protein